ncbi:MAG: EamA/RhaT family transporter [Rhodospirillales bacterium]|jgi:drug/metabolite transporter (DMT)-like permease|nr:EamA/RhaT family transporter [Rhodospirillales bacterium]
MTIATKAQSDASGGSLWFAAMPFVFVVLWSTGFIGAKFGLPYAGPLTFLTLRLTIVAVVMLAVALASGAAWPKTWLGVAHIAVVGILLQGAYLGGVFYGIAHGISAGLAALIAGLQPVLTAALVGVALGERVVPRQWLGLILGLAGVVLVLWSKLVFDPNQLVGLATVTAGLFGITIGTLYQKRFCGGFDLRTATVIQNATAALVMLPLALAGEDLHIVWSASFVFALAYLCLVLSVASTILFLYLLRHGAASRIASYFYLVPPVTALMAYLFFDEMLGPVALVGIAVTAVGVALVNRG